MHDHDALTTPGLSLADLALLLGLSAVLASYVVAARAATRTGRAWPRGRTVSFTTGTVLLLLGLGPPLNSYAHANFAGHMLQHLLIGMLAPIALVLGAPVTLVLRSVRPGLGRRISRILRSRPVHLITRPVTALLLSSGTLWVLYLTPLYNATAQHPVLHAALHVHFVAAGCLFAWVIAGPDPAPNRPSVNVRLVILGLAIVSHATLSQLLYANALVHVAAPTNELRAGATLMYYGGDIAELLLAVALLISARPGRVRAATERIRGTRAGTRDGRRAAQWQRAGTTP